MREAGEREYSEETPPNVRETEGARGHSGESQLYISSGFLKSLRESFSQIDEVFHVMYLDRDIERCEDCLMTCVRTWLLCALSLSSGFHKYSCCCESFMLKNNVIDGKMQDEVL